MCNRHFEVGEQFTADIIAGGKLHTNLVQGSKVGRNGEGQFETLLASEVVYRVYT
jgi:hypothetical protein